MSGVTSGAAFLAEGLVEAVAFGDVSAGSGVVADSASSSAVADHGCWWGPWVAVFATGEEEFSDHC